MLSHTFSTTPRDYSTVKVVANSLFIFLEREQGNPRISLRVWSPPLSNLHHVEQPSQHLMIRDTGKERRTYWEERKGKDNDLVLVKWEE